MHKADGESMDEFEVTAFTFPMESADLALVPRVKHYEDIHEYDTNLGLIVWYFIRPQVDG